MLNVRLSSVATEDVEALWLAMANVSLEQADYWLIKLDFNLRVLAQRTREGCSRDELGAGIRSFAFGDCLIFYRLISVNLNLEIVRILPATRDVPKPSEHTSAGASSAT